MNYKEGQVPDCEQMYTDNLASEQCPAIIFQAIYQGDDKSLARPGRKQATVTKL